MKFKVGDKVEFLGTDRNVGKEYTRGSLWTIQDIDTINYYLEGEYGYWTKDVFEKEFKLVDVGTLKELNVKPGDVVKVCETPGGVQLNSGAVWEIKRYDGSSFFAVKPSYSQEHSGVRLCNSTRFHLISRVPNKPKLWKDMTPEEKGALLLAHQEGKVIEWTDRLGSDFIRNSVTYTPVWSDTHAYRVRPEPKVETLTMYGTPRVPVFGPSNITGSTHKLTYNLVDGKLDYDSLKMEEL